MIENTQQCKKNLLWQLSPSWVLGHAHVLPNCVFDASSVQIPPFWHGFWSHFVRAAEEEIKHWWLMDIKSVLIILFWQLLGKINKQLGSKSSHLLEDYT